MQQPWRDRFLRAACGGSLSLFLCVLCVDSANADLRLKLNAKGVQSEYDEAHGKAAQLEQGFRGTALSSAPPPAALAAAAAAAAASSSAAAAASSTPSASAALASVSVSVADVPTSSSSMDVDSVPVSKPIPVLTPAVDPLFVQHQHEVPEPEIIQAQHNKHSRLHPTDVETETEESKQGMEDENTPHHAADTATPTLIKQEAQTTDHDAAMQDDAAPASEADDAAAR